MMKKALVVLAAMILCGMAFANVKPEEAIDSRLAPPDMSPLSGTWCYTGPGVGIPDNDSGAAVLQLNIPDSETIENLDVDVQIIHTWIGDLRGELTNGACTIQLFHRIGLADDSCCGCSGDDIDSTLDDDGASSIEDSCGSGGSGGSAGVFTPGDPGFAPAAMSDCNGQDVNGTWTLTVTDGAAADTGAVMGFCLTNTTGGGDGGDGGDGGVPASNGLGAILIVLAVLGTGAYFLRR